MKTFINLTPHAIVVEQSDGLVVFEPSGTVARILMREEEIGTVDNIAIVQNVVSGIEGLPESKNATYYIVSAMVLDAAKHLGRQDVLAPNTNKAKRNDKGHIISVPSFVVA